MGSNGSVNKIVLEEVKYGQYVNNIEKYSNALLENKGYVTPDESCKKNVVIPDYQTADHAAIDTIKRFMEIQELVVKLMKKVKDNYKEVNDELDKQLQNASTTSGGGQGK